MRAKFVNEIKISSEDRGLRSLGLGRSALLFINELKKNRPIIDKLRTLDKREMSDIMKDVSLMVSEMLGVPLEKMKYLSYGLFGGLEDKLNSILAKDSTVEKNVTVPWEYVEDEMVYDPTDGSYDRKYVGTGKFSDAIVKIVCNYDNGVAVVDIDYNDPGDIAKNIDDDSLRTKLLFVALA